MRSLLSIVSLPCYALLCCNMAIVLSLKESFKIGIVGGGIGGTSAAYFLRQLFKDAVEIDVFENSPANVGGRLATVKMNNGREYESGGSVIHPKNQYMVEFLEKFDLKKRKAPVDGENTFGIFDGNEFRFTESTGNFMTVLKLLYRYGLDPYWLQKEIEYLLDHFSNIYRMQNQGYAFTNVERILHAMSPKFVERMQQNFNLSMLADGYSQLIIDELLNAIVRVNYGQNTNVHGFVGAVAVAGAQPGLWSVHRGNKVVAQNLLLSSNANFHACHVTAIRRNSGPANHSITCLDENHNIQSFDNYRYVVIATPLYESGDEKIQFENYSFKPVYIPYHRLYANFISGRISKTFACSSCPQEILSCNDSLFFNSLSPNLPVDYNGSEIIPAENRVYKVFSNKILTEKERVYLFDEITEMKIVPWLAYPTYENHIYDPVKFRFELEEGLFHINVIEAAASAMEMSVIGAKNVALLIYNKMHDMLDKIDNVEVVSRQKLQTSTDL